MILDARAPKRGKIAIEFRTDLDKLGPRRRKKHVEVDRSKLRGDRRASTGHRVADGTSPRWARVTAAPLARSPDAAVAPFAVDRRQRVRSVCKSGRRPL